MTTTTGTACRKQAAPHVGAPDVDQLAHTIADTLRRRFPDCAAPDEYLTVARDAISVFAGAKVPNYVPILAQKHAFEVCAQRNQQAPRHRLIG